MSKPQQDAPFAFAFDDRGVLSVQIRDHDGRLLPYCVAVEADGPERFAVRVWHPGSDAPPYVVSKSPGKLWDCTCYYARHGAKYDTRDCKHVVACRGLKSMLNHLRPTEKTMPQNSPDEIARVLKRPFKPSQLGWKAQATSADKSKALAVPYIDARDVQNRLDEAVGIDGWRTSFVQLADHCTLCRLELCIEGQWIPREDVGGASDQPDEGDRTKASVSDALKRAAVAWGVGRYLYYLPQYWLPFDGKKIIGTPDLPHWALPPKEEKVVAQQREEKALQTA